MAKLIPPPNTVVVRMYRIGHGDCFLLAFPGQNPAEPKYVLIDCGYKPGSPAFINTTPKKITDNLREATGGHIDVAIITHEHQDHVSAFRTERPAFDAMRVDQVWLAWTENPQDPKAQAIARRRDDLGEALVHASLALTRPEAPEASYAHLGNGTNAVYVDPTADLVVVARWIENDALPGIVARVRAALRD